MDKALYNTHIQRAIMTCNHCSRDTKVTQQQQFPHLWHSGMPSDHPRSCSEAWPQGTRVTPTNGKFTWKIPILLTILTYLNSGTNNENFILAIFFSFDSSYSSLITKNHSASDITWPIPAKIEARHNQALTHTPLLYCKVRYQLIVVHFKVNSTISFQKVDLLPFFFFFSKKRWCPVCSVQHYCQLLLLQLTYTLKNHF